jgi:hypothetical protein
MGAAVTGASRSNAALEAPHSLYMDIFRLLFSSFRCVCADERKGMLPGRHPTRVDGYGPTETACP